MSSTTLYRLSGLALLLALPFQVAGWILHPPGEQLTDLFSPYQQLSHLIMFFSWLLVLLGLMGFYAKQADRAGVLGLIGFAATMFAIAYHFYLLLYEAYPAVALAYDKATQDLIVTGGPLAHGAGALGPLGFAAVFVFPLFGIVTLRAGVLPRLAGWLPILSVPAFFVGTMLLPERLPGPLSSIAVLYYLLFLGYAWGGYALWTGKERVRKPATRQGAPQPVA